MTIFLGTDSTFIVLSSHLLYPLMVIQSYIISRDKIHKKYLNNVVNQNDNACKTSKVIFAISIVDLLQQYEGNTIKIQFARVIINAQTDQIS